MCVFENILTRVNGDYRNIFVLDLEILQFPKRKYETTQPTITDFQILYLLIVSWPFISFSIKVIKVIKAEPD